MEEVIKFDMKGLWAKIFGSSSKKDDEEVAKEVEDINKISSGISWDAWEASSNLKKHLPPERVNTRTTIHRVKAKGETQKGLEKE